GRRAAGGRSAPRGETRRRADRSHAEGVRPARPAGPSSRERHHPPRPARAGVGPGRVVRDAVPAGVRPRPPQEAGRRRPPRATRHRAGCRLPARRPGLGMTLLAATHAGLFALDGATSEARPVVEGATVTALATGRGAGWALLDRQRVGRVDG